MQKRKAERLLGQIEANQVIDGVGVEPVTEYLRSLSTVDYQKFKVNRSGYRAALRSGNISWQRIGNISKKNAKCLLDSRLLAKESESITRMSQRIVEGMKKDAEESVLKYYIHKKIRDQETLMKSINDKRRLELEWLPKQRKKHPSLASCSEYLQKSKSTLSFTNKKHPLEATLKDEDDFAAKGYSTFNMTGLNNLHRPTETTEAVGRLQQDMNQGSTQLEKGKSGASGSAKTEKANFTEMPNHSVFERLYQKTASESAKLDIEKTLSQTKLSSSLPKVRTLTNLSKVQKPAIIDTTNIFNKKALYKQIFHPTYLSTSNYLIDRADPSNSKLLDEKSIENQVSLALQSPSHGFLCYKMDKLTQLAPVPYCQVYKSKHSKPGEALNGRLQRSGSPKADSKTTFLANLAKHRQISSLQSINIDRSLDDISYMNEASVILVNYSMLIDKSMILMKN